LSFCPRRAASCQSCGSRRTRCQLTDDAARPRHPQRLGPAQPASARRRRAQRGSVLDAAVEALARDPQVSIAEIARRAGVVRETIYVHYPTRESLLEAVSERAIAEVTEAMARPRRHRPAFALLQPLIERGQRAGTFRSDLPAQWHLAMLLALIHAASAELQSKRLPSVEIEPALATTVLGAPGVTGASDEA
jgi:AcrR family transcriptional regulator